MLPLLIHILLFIANNPSYKLSAFRNFHDSPSKVVVLVNKVDLLVEALLRAYSVELSCWQLPVHLGRVAVDFVSGLDEAVHMLGIPVFAG